MFGFMRMSAVLIGACIIAIAALNAYVGYGTFEGYLGQVPAYYQIRGNPGLAGMIGSLLIIIAFVFPAGGKHLNDGRL
ncbi:MAG: hypothetical protein ACE5F9_08475 [Phycisphaerae bacterium]